MIHGLSNISGWPIQRFFFFFFWFRNVRNWSTYPHRAPKLVQCPPAQLGTKPPTYYYVESEWACEKCPPWPFTGCKFCHEFFFFVVVVVLVNIFISTHKKASTYPWKCSLENHLKLWVFFSTYRFWQQHRNDCHQNEHGQNEHQQPDIMIKKIKKTPDDIRVAIFYTRQPTDKRKTEYQESWAKMKKTWHWSRMSDTLDKNGRVIVNKKSGVMLEL